MGNYISCACTFIPQPSFIDRRRLRALRVVFPGGEIRQFREPVSAAELMLDCPGFFLANSRSLHVGRRFSPLGADEELELGNVYIMFPMKRANSVIMAVDMAAVFMASSSVSKKITGARVGALPDEANSKEGKVAEAACSAREPVREDEAEGVLAVAAPEFGYRLAVCRSKKPSLETIKEEPPVRGRSRC
ncbi:uncharacterized protein LOC116200499 [Punica granatum]|uniref:DUF4228 domain-containing protein n=2 Tax=Punica granatum TaxID=22663 RepID=A0A218W7I6_PUNGR|nr:uncharacterized protein LOC116200499 [Punica granatum]OWM68062.1 hypothetical protein CDL15_Pgr017630 [Punica granatum]PKI69374.1 hypothetical protein CRG98_010172 [Punica granatum]